MTMAYFGACKTAVICMTFTLDKRKKGAVDPAVALDAQGVDGESLEVLETPWHNPIEQRSPLLNLAVLPTGDLEQLLEIRPNQSRGS